MSQDERSPEVIQLTKLVAWLDEQRKQDKELTARLSQQVERLSAEVRDGAAQLIDLHDRLRQSQTAIARLPTMDGALRQVREQLADLQRDLQELGQREGHNSLLQQTEVSRVAKALADLTQQAAELHRRDEAHLSRMQVLSEEMKHDRAAFAPLSQQIEHGEKQWAALAWRTQLVEEQLKRAEGLVAGLSQSDEELNVEQRKLWQWQQSAELRWARQLAEWEQQLEQWQLLLDDQAKSVQGLLRDSKQSNEVIEAVRRELAEQHEQLQVQLNEIRRITSVQEVAHEEGNRLLQGIEAQRRRIDEQAGGLRQLDETLRQEAAELTALGRRLDNERARIDELAIAMRQQGQEQRDDYGALAQLTQELRSQRYELQDEMARFVRELAELRQSHRDRLAELLVLQERHRVRQIDELEQQVRELREQGDGIGVTSG